jgi:hypothetical protein
MRRVAGELKDVPLADPQVLLQSPRGVRNTVYLRSSEGLRQPSDGLFKVQMCPAPLQQVDNVFPQRLV